MVASARRARCGSPAGQPGRLPTVSTRLGDDIWVIPPQCGERTEEVHSFCRSLPGGSESSFRPSGLRDLADNVFSAGSPGPRVTTREQGMMSGNLGALESCCIHPRSLLTEMPSVSGDDFTLGRLRNGAQSNLPEFSSAPLVKVFAGQRELVGIARRVAGTLFQPVVVMG